MNCLAFVAYLVLCFFAGRAVTEIVDYFGGGALAWSTTLVVSFASIIIVGFYLEV